MINRFRTHSSQTIITFKNKPEKINLSGWQMATIQHGFFTSHFHTITKTRDTGNGKDIINKSKTQLLLTIATIATVQGPNLTGQARNHYNR